ncbi:MAG: fructose-bisphosphatase class II [Leptospiraceae bacterium]|nr:fructose-bisphosphatase class II [Leptospiraceae bacterium]MDW7976028.1 fructose-bisphosphatase class II [Leptospiraceae bacterium]
METLETKQESRKERKSDIIHLHEIAQDFIKVTDTVARGIYELSGKGQKEKADQIAAQIMEETLNSLPYKIQVLIGEGEKDHSGYGGHRKILGIPYKEMLDLEAVIDPLECTSNFAKGLPDSMSVLLIAEKDTIQAVPKTYMKQLLLPKEVRDLGKLLFMEDKFQELDTEHQELIKKYFYIDIDKEGTSKIHIKKELLDADPKEILMLTALALHRDISDLTVVVQDRPRHSELIDRIRELGAGVALIDSGSISASAEIIVRKEGRMNLLIGIYGAPEGLIQAFMAKSTHSIFLGRIQPHNEKTEIEAEELGILNQTLNEDEWIKGEAILIMTGIHSSIWLPGIRKVPKKKVNQKQVSNRSSGLPEAPKGKNHRLMVSTVIWTINNVMLVELEDGDFRRKEIIFQ